MKKKRRRCKETKHYRRVVRNRVQEIFGRYDKLCNNNNCDFCFKNSFASYNGITVNNKLKIDCWSNDNLLSPRQITKSCDIKFLFICDNCPHSFLTKISNIYHSNNWCPYCCNPVKKLCEDINCNFCFKNSFLISEFLF